MSYIMDLRRFVGHARLIQCAGSVIIENEQGEILLGRRTDNHLWCYAGGAIEPGESIEDCARRELFEETGLTAGEMTLFGVFSGPETHYTYPNGDQASVVDIVYLCDDYSGEMRPQPEEVTELRWFAPADIPADDQLSPPNIPAIRMWQRSYA